MSVRLMATVTGVTRLAAGGRSSDWLSSILHERGHRIEGLHMCKLIPLVA